MNELEKQPTQTPIEIALQIDENGMTTARKLYEFLELNKTQFSRWAKTNIENNEFYEEDKDWCGFDIVSSGNECKDYYLTTDFAKHLSMESHSSKGKIARQYFITVEDKLKEVAKPRCIEDVLIESLREMKAVREKIAEQNKEIAAVQGRVESIREVVALDTTSWREETGSLLKKMGHILGGGPIYSQVRAESYELLEKRMGVSLSTRLNLMNDGLQTTEELQNMIFQSAQASRGAYMDTASVVAKLGNNARDAFSSNKEIVGFAELVNKQFTIAGASTVEASNAFLQLTQAMGSGVLRGDELNSIFEQAPNLIQNIADYLEVPIGTIREMAKDGEITADIVKSAMFAAADDINEKFASMPMTWGQIATSIQNQALMAFQPILAKINEIANSNRFNSFVSGMIGSLYALADVAVGVFEALITIGSFLYDNWDLISPVVYAVATALLFYNGVLIASNIIQGVSNTLKAIAAVRSVAHGTATAAEAAATTGMTASQVAFNAALYACPLTWIILLIIAIISIIYMVVAAINHWKGTTISATGVIVGALAVLGAYMWNNTVGTINAVIQFLWTSFVEPIISIVEWVLNVMNGGFDSFGDAVANLIGQIISWFLSLGKVVTTIIDAIFGTNWTSGLNSLQSEVLGWGKNNDAITLDRNAPQINTRIAYSDAYDAGYKFGQGIDDKVSGFLSGGDAANPYGDMTDYLGDISNSTANGADSTEKIADAMEITEEDLKYLRDIAEREIIDRTVFKSLSIDMGGVSNTVNNMTDLDGIADYLGDVISQTASASMEGV